MILDRVAAWLMLPRLASLLILLGHVLGVGKSSSHFKMQRKKNSRGVLYIGKGHQSVRSAGLRNWTVSSQTQSTYRGRVQIGGVYLTSHLEHTPQLCTWWKIQHSERVEGVLCRVHPPPPPTRLGWFSHWCNVRQKVSIATRRVLCGHKGNYIPQCNCHTVYVTLPTQHLPPRFDQLIHVQSQIKIRWCSLSPLALSVSLLLLWKISVKKCGTEGHVTHVWCIGQNMPRPWTPNKLIESRLDGEWSGLGRWWMLGDGLGLRRSRFIY